MMEKIIFADQTTDFLTVCIYQGACLAGQSTAYVRRNGKMIWVQKLRCSNAWLECPE